MTDLADAPFLTAQDAPGAALLPDAPFASPVAARAAHGPLEALQAGYQGSATGLALRGRLPDVVLDSQHSKWYEKALATIGQMGAEAPEMVVGGVLGAMGGTATAGPVGGLLGGGAGSFAIPAAIRQSLIEAYKSGTVDSSGGFLNSARIVLAQSAKEGAIGALTFGVGGMVARGIGKAIAPAIGESMGVSMATKIISGAQTAAELGTMVVAPAALDGHLPEPEDFLNAAIVIGAAKGAMHVAGPAAQSIAEKLGTIYAKTGVRPEQVVADAARDPKIAEELGDGVRVYRGTAGRGHDFTDPERTGGIFFTKDRAYAEEMAARAARKYGGEPRVDEFVIGMKNPAPRGMSIERAKELGHDGAIFGETSGKSEYIVFDQGQVRSPGDIPSAYKPMAAEEVVRNAMPDPVKVQQVVSNLSGTITAGKEPNHINYRYIESPQDIQALHARISEVFTSEIEAARGSSKGWDASAAEARQALAASLGVKPDALQRGNLSLDAEIMAKNAMMQRAAFDVAEAARVVREAGDAVTEPQARAMQAAVETLSAIQANFLGNAAELGRALNAMKAAKQTNVLSKDLALLRERFGDDPKLIAKMIGELGTVEKIGRFAREATTFEKFVEAWKAGILSGPVTHIANVIGNTTFMAMRPVIDLTASVIGKVTGAEERVVATEPMARVFGNLQGAKDALMLAGSAMRLAYEEGGIKGLAKEIAVGSGAEGPQKVEQFRKAIGGVKGDVIRLPFRALSLADEFFKNMNERGEAYALATRQAVKEGFNIQTREFRERVADLVQNDVGIGIESKAAALRFTFNAPLGEKGQAVQNLVRQAHLEVFVPFIRTPGNILKELVRMTPGAPLVKEWREAWKAGGVERAKAVAEFAMGSAVMGVVASYVFDGSLTGQGSPDPGKRRVATAAGWQPYSVKIGDTYYSYQRLQPVGTLMGLAADMAEVWDHLTEEESDKVPKMISIAFANAVTNQTFLQGITNIVNAMSDPKRFGPKMAQNMAASTVPAIIGQPTTMSDPYVREINSILDAVRSRIPGQREQLLPKRDVFGQPVQTKVRLGGLSPVTETTASEDKVRTEASRLGVSVADAPKKVHLGRGTGKLGDVEISPEQRNLFGEVSGKFAAQIMGPIVSAPTWDALPDLVKKRLYQRVFTAARKQAAAQVFTGAERDALIGQITERVQEELRPGE